MWWAQLPWLRLRLCGGSSPGGQVGNAGLRGVTLCWKEEESLPEAWHQGTLPRAPGQGRGQANPPDRALKHICSPVKGHSQAPRPVPCTGQGCSLVASDLHLTPCLASAWFWHIGQESQFPLSVKGHSGTGLHVF